MKLARIIACLAWVGVAVAAEPGIEFSGVLTDQGKTQLALTDKATGTTRWLEAGADFNGYVVASYNAKDDTITLKRNGEELQLPLVAAKSRPSGPPVTTTVGAAAPPPAGGLSGGSAVTSTTVTGAAAASPPANALVAPPVAMAAAPTGLAPTTPPTPSPPGASDAPTTTGVSYVAQPGDTLAKIAATSGLSLTELQALNPGVNPNALKAGQSIRVR